jgi:hypothetical protein
MTLPEKLDTIRETMLYVLPAGPFRARNGRWPMMEATIMRLGLSKVVKVRVSNALQMAVETAARRDHSTVSEFIRRTVVDRLRADGMLPD